MRATEERDAVRRHHQGPDGLVCIIRAKLPALDAAAQAAAEQADEFSFCS